MKRRSFLNQLAVIAGSSSVAADLFAANSLLQTQPTAGKNGTTILFQGDSITDGNRTRNNDWNHVIGHGYQYIIASKMWYEHPGKNLHFFNRGISGNKVTDLAARWQNDTINLSPDVLSILIGINDTAAFIQGKNEHSAEQFERQYRALLQQTKQQLPQVQLVLCEPFVLKVGKVANQWSTWMTETAKRAAIVKLLSKEFDAVFVPFQTAFNNALQKAPAEYWIWDGIHPMPAGHELMAREWMKHVGRKISFIQSG